MKTLSLFVASLLVSTGASFAQFNNTAIVTETGKDHIALIQQVGIQNESNVIQSNKKNKAIVTQTNQNVLNSTYSEVKQSGEENLATVSQVGTSSLTGLGTGELKALVDQTGNRNEALQVQGSHEKQGQAFAQILQSGNDNYAAQYQVKYGNHAIINQSGNMISAIQ